MAAKMTTAEKIAQLLAKAESTDSPAEAEALSSAAEKLMLRHGLEMAEIDAARQGTDVKREDVIKIEVFVKQSTYDKALHNLMVSIAAPFGCQVVQSVSRFGEKGTTLHIIGFTTDIENVQRLYTSLVLQANTAVNAFAKTNPLWKLMTATEKYNDRRTFLFGFGNGVAARLYSEKAEAVQESGKSTELVLVDRSKKVAEKTSEYFPRLGTGRTVNLRGSAASGRAGREAGRTASMGGASISNRKEIG